MSGKFWLYGVLVLAALVVLIILPIHITLAVKAERKSDVSKDVAQVVVPEDESLVLSVKEVSITKKTAREMTIDVILPKVRYIVPPSEVIISELAETPPPVPAVKSPVPVVTPPVPATIEQKVEVVVMPDVLPPSTPQRMVIHPEVRLVHRAPPPEKIYSTSQP